jgi:hypothetical protein
VLRDAWIEADSADSDRIQRIYAQGRKADDRRNLEEIG